METAARQLVECHDPRIAQICDGLWEHSLSVAILSHDLVAALPGLDAEAGYLAGLLHDIGRPVVAEMLLDAEARLLGKRVDRWIMPSKWLGIIVQCERTVGLAVTRSWTLPESVVDAVGLCDQYDTERPFRVPAPAEFRQCLGLQQLDHVVDQAVQLLAAVAGHDLSVRPVEETAAIVENGTALLGLDGDTIAGVMTALPGRLAGRMA